MGRAGGIAQWPMGYWRYRWPQALSYPEFVVSVVPVLEPEDPELFRWRLRRATRSSRYFAAVSLRASVKGVTPPVFARFSRSIDIGRWLRNSTDPACAKSLSVYTSRTTFKQPASHERTVEQ